MKNPVRLILALIALLYQQAAMAELTVIYNKNEDKHYVSLLKEALERTRSEGGYTLKSSESTFGTARAIDEIADNTGGLSIITRGTNIEEEKKLLPIKIPLEKGLLGYRIMVVREKDLPKLASLQSLDELKQLRIGQGSRWPDTKILEAAGFKITKGYYSAGLLRMLHEERFDLFARATWEAQANIAEAKKQGLNDLVVEPTFAIHYPMPRIFMVSRKGDGPALAARIERGLRIMIKDGSFDVAFNAFFGPALEAAKLHERKIFSVPNKYLPPDTPLDDKSLWLDAKKPYTASPSKP